MSDDVSALAAVPVLASVDPQRLADLAARSARVRVAPGKILAMRGAPAAHLLVVESGMLVAVHDAADGRRITLGDFPAPCAVDKSAVLDAGGYTATWTAATRSTIRFLPAGDLIRLVDDLPALRRHVLAYLATQVRDAQAAVVRTSLGTGLSRVAQWLVAAAGERGRRVDLPRGQQGLADALGISRVTVSRALNQLGRDGLVRLGPGVVHILAPELLTRRAR